MKGYTETRRCRCGKVHEGAYAQEEWARHQCLHEEQLTGVDVERGRVYPEERRAGPERSRRVQVVCPGCGQSWIASIHPEQGGRIKEEKGV